MTTATLDEQPTTTASRVVIEPSRGWMSLELRALWEHRELLYFFVWRDIKAHYKQTALGVAWVVLQPIISMGVFSVLFGLLLGAPVYAYVSAMSHWKARARVRSGDFITWDRDESTR